MLLSFSDFFSRVQQRHRRVTTLFRGEEEREGGGGREGGEGVEGDKGMTSDKHMGETNEKEKHGPIRVSTFYSTIIYFLRVHVVSSVLCTRRYE